MDRLHRADPMALMTMTKSLQRVPKIDTTNKGVTA